MSKFWDAVKQGVAEGLQGPEYESEEEMRRDGYCPGCGNWVDPKDDWSGKTHDYVRCQTPGCMYNGRYWNTRTGRT